jgi:ATP-dependent protease ClpP protease subunit
MTIAYLNFHAPINPLTVQHFMSTCGQLVQQQHDALYLCLSTPGGEVPSGVTLYDFLRALPVHVTTHNMGNIDSIGNAIFLAGEKRLACKHSTFMFHGVGFDMQARTRLEEKNIREMHDAMLADQSRIASIIVERTAIDNNQARELFIEARTKNADDALKHGIIHEIADLSIPAGAPILSLVFN